MSGGYTETNGFNSCDGRSGLLFIGCFATEPDKDAYRNANASIRVGHRFADNAEIEFLVYTVKVKVNTMVILIPQTFLQHTYGTTLSADMTENWKIIATLSQGRLEADNEGAFCHEFWR